MLPSRLSKNSNILTVRRYLLLLVLYSELKAVGIEKTEKVVVYSHRQTVVSGPHVSEFNFVLNHAQLFYHSVGRE